MRSAVAACLLVLCAEAHAQSPIERYRSATGPNLVLCALSVEVSQLKKVTEPTASGGSPEECVTRAKDAADKAYADLAKTLRSKAALDALKTTQAAFSTALQGVMPDYGETKMAYRARTSAQKARFQEAMERLRLEM